VNPYAIWPVTQTVDSVTAGDVLVDNFNNKSNNQGTGTTIVNMHPNGKVGVFASLPATVPGCPGGVGLTTVMVQLHSGWIIVGSLPGTDGKIDTVGAGCLPAGTLPHRSARGHHLRAVPGRAVGRGALGHREHPDRWVLWMSSPYGDDIDLSGAFTELDVDIRYPLGVNRSERIPPRSIGR
jgi:hypothetical protein